MANKNLGNKKQMTQSETEGVSIFDEGDLH